MDDALSSGVRKSRALVLLNLGRALIGIRSLSWIGLRLYECEVTGRGRKRPRLCLGAVDARRRERGRWAAERKNALMNSSAMNSSEINSSAMNSDG
jgi:hypothetical protein